MTEKTFAEQVEQAAKESGLAPDDAPPMTPEEESIPADEHTPIPKEVAEPEPEPGEEKEPVKAEAEPEPPKEEPKQEPPQNVPLAVHIRQREKYEAQQAELKRIIEVGNQRLAELTRALAPEAPPVDRNTDPLGATLQEVDGLRNDLKQTKEMLEADRLEKANREAINQFQNWVAADEQAFSQQAPDYPQAVQYVKAMKVNEYMALGLPEQDAKARVMQDAYALAQHAAQQGLSPSELAYRMANALGYKKQAAAPQQEKTVPEKTQAETAVEMRAAGASRGKGTGGASATGGAMSFAELAALDNEEFAKMTSGKKWQRLFGGG